MKKQDAALHLYIAGMSQTDIAELVGVRVQTVNQWKQKGSWDRQKATKTGAEQTAKEGLLAILNHNILVLRTRIAEQHDAGVLTLISAGDVDALKKLESAVRDTEQKWTAYVSILREFLTYLESEDLEKAKSLLPFTTAFLDLKRQHL